MTQCVSSAAIRDENGEVKHDYVTGEVLTRDCRFPAMHGTNPPRCVQHATPYDRQKRMQATFMKRHGDSVIELLQALDIPNLHPMDGLLEAVRLSGNMMRVFQVLVSELPERPIIETKIIDGVVTEVTTMGIWGYDHNMDQSPHVLMNLLTMWTDRYTRACKMALDAGIDERMVRNAETTSATFLTAFERAINSIEGLTETMRIAIGQAMAREVRQAVQPQLIQLEAS